MSPLQRRGPFGSWVTRSIFIWPSSTFLMRSLFLSMMDVGVGVDEVGEDVGVEVGEDVGVEVGEAEGVEVGEDVGVKVGEEIGVEVGEDVGVEVVVELLAKPRTEVN